MCLERANNSFSCVALMYVRRYLLIISVPFFLDEPIILRASFIVEYSYINSQFMVAQSLHEFIVYYKTVHVLS